MTRRHGRSGLAWRLGGLALIGAFTLAACSAAPEAEAEVTITLRDHRFEPADVTAPAGKRLKLIVRNSDATAEEFESHDLDLEKIINGGKEATLYVGPLEAGTYGFFGEFNPDTAQGRLIVE
ncbi:MAG: cupredoxin domain-containing protein [Pseudomonadota bacterium]